jgi:hypothetical protein
VAPKLDDTPSSESEAEMRPAEAAVDSLDEEQKPTTDPASASLGFRVWHDAERERQVVARYIRSDGESVTLVRRDGELKTVPVLGLCEEDQAYIQSRIALDSEG